ncbi:HAMP domain-containing histidine kinase [Helicobacter apodemus]|uniref:histidine kinase n=1 Tax=Helicobacter apodemus TaxID=135569 RepID=A0A4U8UG74_9HELI|nr:HAMP domain-containing histidine kinase [Helicobacter apodemus]
MLSKRSIRGDYTKQIIISFVAFLTIFSLLLYSYLYYATYTSVKHNIYKYIDHILQNNIHYKAGKIFYIQDLNPLTNEKLKIEVFDEKIPKNLYESIQSHQSYYYSISTPYLHNKTLKITQNITKEVTFLNTLLEGIIVVFFFCLILIQLFALAFSNILYKPIQKLSTTLSKLKEYDLELIDERVLPLEFNPLVTSINNLLQRIKNYFNTQKQLFIGIAHELKTPLAVIKTKCEVTLIKEREKEIYINALKENIHSINEINTIVKTLLGLGRQESAQFEKSIHLDITKALRNIAENFKILSQKEKKNFTYKLQTQGLFLMIKPTLLTQVIQNFLQNAFKFTPEGKNIFLQSLIVDNEILKIVVIDEGCGVDSELEDIYAPFKRAGNKSGAGLGLFLAKNAATNLGGSISLQNRMDKKGAIATFELKIPKWNNNC